MKLVLASNNKGKLAELQALFAPLGVELVPQSALGISEAAEPFHTFIENALAKARHAAKATGLPALAIPAGFTPRGLPVGLELLGAAFAEPRLLALGHGWEQLAKPRQPPFSTPPLVAGERIFVMGVDRAVRAFQKAHGLTVDAVVGPATPEATSRYASLAPFQLPTRLHASPSPMLTNGDLPGLRWNSLIR